MRVTNRAATRNYLRYVNKGLSDQAKVQERVASGNRFEKVSDDVSSGIQAMKAKTEQYKMEKQIGNIEDINNVLVAAEDSMMTINEQLANVHTRLLRAINDPNTNNRNILALEIKALKEEILQMANSQYNGQFLFSASNNYEPPFSVDKETGKIMYNGVGVPADEIFRREDGTYYYKTKEYDENGNPIQKVVPDTNADGSYRFELTSAGGTTVSVTGLQPTAGTPPYYQDAKNTNVQYVEDPNNAGSYLKLDSSTRAFDLNGGAMDDGVTGHTPDAVTQIGTSNIYQSNANPNVLYALDPGGSGKYFALGTDAFSTPPALGVDATDPDNIKIQDGAGTDIATVTLKAGDAATNDRVYEVTANGPLKGTLYVEDSNNPGTFHQVANKKDINGNLIKENIGAYRDVPLNEKIYLDVGLGIRMTGSTVDPQTAFDVTYVGPDVMGFGIDEKTGISNNLYNLLTDIEKVVNEQPFATDTARELGAHLLTRMDAFRENITDIGAKTQFLETMLDRLNKSRDNLEISIGNYTGTDYVEESRHQASASAVINALYQLGSNIIPLSLMDFVS